MAHFAELNQNNEVLRVVVVSNAQITVDGVENEKTGVEFCKSLFGTDTRWRQTSYNANIRKHFAGVGFSYDEALDAFVPPKCHDEAVLDTEACVWLCGDSLHTSND